VNILSVGRRRLKIEIRIERLPESATSRIEQAWFDRRTREAALAEREHWELEHLARTGWLR